MKKTIVDKSAMQCSLGTKPSQIIVTSQSFSSINGKLIATEVDKEGMTNIPSFGNCRCVWYQPACVPKPVMWVKTAKGNAINGMKKLTQQSECSCVKGGTISFVDTGVNQFSDIE